MKKEKKKNLRRKEEESKVSGIICILFLLWLV